MRRAIEEFQDAGVEADIWKIEGIDTQEDCELIAQTARRGGRDGVVCVVLGRGADDEKVDHWLRQGAPVEGYAGFAIGRTIWWDALKGFLDGNIEREDAAAADRRQLPALRAGLRRGGEAGGAGVSIQPGATFRRPPKRKEGVGSLPGAMRMRQSLAQFEAAFREEADESVVRRERLRKHGRSALARPPRRAPPQGGQAALRAARADDRGHRRGGHDRDVRDAARCSAG